MTDGDAVANKLSAKTLVPLGCVIALVVGGWKVLDSRNEGEIARAVIEERRDATIGELTKSVRGLSQAVEDLQEQVRSANAIERMLSWVTQLRELNQDKIRVPEFR